MANLTKNIFRWLPSAFVMTILCGLVYGTVQQNFRQSLNDPQIQIAEDIADSLSQGNTVEAIFVGNTKVDVAKSLAPFAIAFDANGKVLASNLVLDGKTPEPPKGVLEAASKKQNRVTWQPKPGVRIAAVVVKYETDKGKGFVLAGRNMREVEARESQLSLMVLLAWIVALAGSFALKYAAEKFVS